MKQERLQKLLTDFRHQLHQHPELSGQEILTAQRVAEFLAPTLPNQIYRNVGGHGLIAEYDSGQPGPSIMIRCELDALPITELNDFAYKSLSPHVAHKCGHDGHMAILCGLAYLLEEEPLTKGKVLLLFQPEEETGHGAKRILQDPVWEQLRPDFMFALHNIPGLPKHQICSKPGVFAAASKGITVTLSGHTAHAAHPEQGNSPCLALSYLMEHLTQLPQKAPFEDFTLVTVVHALMGEAAFGVTPGYAELRATLRSFQNTDMDTLTRLAEDMIRMQAEQYGLAYEISYHEPFVSTQSNPEAYQYIERAAQKTNLSFTQMEYPMRWSEDFGYYTPQTKTAFFGLGSGEEQPVLHHATFDFPDDIILSGSGMFLEIIRSMMEDY